MDWLSPILKGVSDVGAANILREKVGFIELQRDQAIAQRDVLAKEKALLQQRIEQLESEAANMEAKLTQAREELLRLKKSPNDQTLPELSERMLVLIANADDDIRKEDVVRQLELSQAKGDYHFDQLLKLKFVRQSYAMMNGSVYYAATAAGREYMANAGLL